VARKLFLRRTRTALRFRALVDEISADLGGADRLSALQKQLTRRAAELSVQCELMEARWASGEEREGDLEAKRCGRRPKEPLGHGSIASRAMFNLAIDSKLRGCDLVALKVEDLAPSGRGPQMCATLAGRAPGYVSTTTRVPIGVF
jgi:hypothetical protein